MLSKYASLSKDDIEALLLKKERFWCGTLVTQHISLSGSHDWNCVKRTEKLKEWYFQETVFVLQNVAVLHQAGA